MKRDVIIGIDAGTSMIKAVAFSLTGEQLALASRENHYSALANGGVEQNMQRTWEDTTATLRALAEQLPNLAERCLSLAVTAQGDGTWLIDQAGQPIHDAWLWLDARAADEARELAQSDAHSTLYQQTGTGVNVCQMRTHLYWMKRHAPELLNKASTALHCKDWLYFKLCGERATDPSEGVFTWGDFRARDYSSVVLDALELSEYASLLPEIVDGVQQAGQLSATAAEATGLPSGLPVSLGYVDVVCTALGGGLFDPAARPGLSIIGSTGMHMRFAAKVDEVRLNPEETGYTMSFPDGTYAQMQSNMAATLNIDWLLDIGRDVLRLEGIERSRRDLLAHLDSGVQAAPIGTALYHPYISAAGERGPFIDPAARASFMGLEQNTGFFELMRSVYEGLALSARDCYQAMGPLPHEIRLSGGAARSKALRHIMGAVLHAPIRQIDRAEAGAAGAAMMSAVQQGLYPDMAACVADWVTPLLGDSEPADRELAPRYDELFALYQTTRTTLAPLWQQWSSRIKHDV